MKTILITGINGYLGSHLAKRYCKRYQIIGLEYDCVDLYRLKDFNFKVYFSKNGIPEDLFEHNQINIVIHAATFYGKSDESDSQLLYSNTYISQSLLEKAVINKCELFINTDTVLNRFTSAYSLTKKQFTDWLIFYSKIKKIRVVNLELEHFIGPGTSSSNLITLMVQKMLVNEPVIALTKCEQYRDFLYIDDLLRVYDLMLNMYMSFNMYESFGVGSGINTNLKKIFEFIKSQTASLSILDFGAVDYRNDELMVSSVDIAPLKSMGWKAEVSVYDAIKLIIKYESN